MIFVTVGTHQQPFVRLMDCLQTLERTDLVVQHGHSPAPRGVSEAVAFMPFAAVLEHLRDAEAVITHAGVGSIMLARRAGHRPLVVPRPTGTASTSTTTRLS